MKGAEKVKGVFHTKHNCQKYPETSGLATHTTYPTGQKKNKCDLRQEKSAPVTESILPLQIAHCLVKTKSQGSLIFPTAEHRPEEQLPVWLNEDERFLSLCFPSLSHPFHPHAMAAGLERPESPTRFCAARGCPQLLRSMNMDASSPHHLPCRKHPGVSAFSGLARFCLVICLLVVLGWFGFLQMPTAVYLTTTCRGFSSKENLLSGSRSDSLPWNHPL